MTLAVASIALFASLSAMSQSNPNPNMLAVHVPPTWAGQELIVRSWMEPGEAAPAWNGQPASERHADRSIPYASEQSLIFPGSRWDWPRYCLLREFVVPGSAVKGGVNALEFAGDAQTRGEISIGTMPTTYGMCGDASHSRKTSSLNGDTWRFKLVANYAEGEDLRLRGFKGVRQHLRVPANWEMEGFSKPTYGQWADSAPSIGMYNRAFAVEAPRGRRVHLAFEGASNNTTVWVNGKWVGEHESGFTPFDYDITDAIERGKNDLSLRVSKYCRSAFFENAGQAGYWYLGGVFRPVWVYSTPATYVSGFRTDTRFAKNYASAAVTVTAEITATDSTGGKAAVRAKLVGPDGKSHRATSAVFALPQASPGWKTVRLVQAVVEVPNVALWTAETPHLYKLRVELISPEDAVKDSVEDEIGLREIRIEGQLFKVNGVPIKLRGMCRHDFSATDGNATKPELWRRDLDLMRQAGINAVRCSHYSPAEGFIRLCDKMGFYVIQEAAAMWVGENADTWYPDYHVRAMETQRRDMNRACVLMWGLGNEHRDTINFRRAALFCRRNDARPVIYAGSATELDGDLVTPHYVKDRIVQSLDVEPKRPVVCTEDFTQSRSWWPKELSFDDAFKAYWDQTILPEDRINGMFIWEWDERAVVYRDSILLSNTAAYGLNSYESQVGPWRRTNLPWFNLLREVYAPIRIDLDGLSLVLRNQYDFTSLGQVEVNWRVSSVDGALKPKTAVSQGEFSLTMPPRTRFQHDLPGVGRTSDWQILDVTLRYSGKADTRRLWIAPTDTPIAITSRSEHSSVWLPERDPGMPYHEPPLPIRPGRILMAEGKRGFDVDPRTGLLDQIRTASRSIEVRGMFVNLWITPPGASNGGFPDRKVSLDALRPQYGTLSFDSPDGIVCTATSSHAGNPIGLRTVCTPTADGVLVRYRADWSGPEQRVPAVGVRFEVPASFASWKWRGRGPWATYPNLTYGAAPGIYEAPIVSKRKVGPAIPMKDEPLIGQWEEQGGTKSDVDRFWLHSSEGDLQIVLGRRAFVECERVGDRVEVRINAKVAELGDRGVPLGPITGEFLIRWPK